MTRLPLPAIALGLLISGNAWADLKTYDVDPRYQQEIYAALKEILEPTPNPQIPAQGRVELLPSGQLLVNAPAETLVQVEGVLQAIRGRPTEPTPRVQLNYWAVLGSRAAGSAPPGAAPPSSLRDVLEQIERVHGNLSFRVIGTVALTTQSGQRGEVGGLPLYVEQTAFIQGDMLNATIGMNLVTTDDPQLVEVSTALRRGEFVVLGQSELVGGELDGPVFFIVHWPDNTPLR